MEMTLRQARALRAAMETAAKGLDDEAASAAAVLFPQLRQDGGRIEAGSRINWNGTVKRAAADMLDSAENTPEMAPGLWEDLDDTAGIRMLPRLAATGTALAKGEKG